MKFNQTFKAAEKIGALIEETIINHIRKEEIVRLRNGNYQIGNVIFERQHRLLVSHTKETKVPNQSFRLLLDFLEADAHRVNKQDIKIKFWASASSTTNMTTAIGRVKALLHDSGCPYTIAGDPADNNYYELKHPE